jgi:O-antigen/teichoic acid export membrane protein
MKASFYKITGFLSNLMSNNRAGVLSSSVSMLFTQFAMFGCQFVSGIILARVLQPAGRGQYAIFILIPTCTQLLGNLALGIPVGFFSAKDPSKAPALNANNVYITFILTAIYSSILLFMYHFQLFGNFADLLEMKYVILICLSIFLMLFVCYSQSLFLGTNYIPAKNTLRILEPITFILFLIILAISGSLNVWTAFTAWVSTRAVGFLLSIIFLLRLKLFSIKPDLKLFIKSIKMSSKGIPAEIAGFIVLQSDIFMLRFFVDDKATGIYSIAASLSFILMSIPQSIGLALFPNIAKTEHLEGIDGTEKTILTCRITIIITLFISFIAIALSPFMIEFLYGESFKESVLPFMMLAVAVSFAGFVHVLNAQLYARGKMIITTGCAIFAALMNVSLNVYLIPKYTYIGAAGSSLISYVFFGVTLSIFYARMIKKPAKVVVPTKEEFRFLYRYLQDYLMKIKAKIYNKEELPVENEE